MNDKDRHTDQPKEVGNKDLESQPRSRDLFIGPLLLHQATIFPRDGVRRAAEGLEKVE